jgi:hypothetical protein
MLLGTAARAQVIEFESKGLKYQALTRSSVTVMYAVMPNHLHEYGIIQVAVSNGSQGSYVIKPEDFTFVRSDGLVLRASPARTVVDMLSQKGRASDVINLVTSYENAVYGNSRLKSTNGYEQRRQSALAMGGTKLKAMAAASAAGVSSHASGQSTRFRAPSSCEAAARHFNCKPGLKEEESVRSEDGGCGQGAGHIHEKLRRVSSDRGW